MSAKELVGDVPLAKSHGARMVAMEVLAAQEWELSAPCSGGRAARREKGTRNHEAPRNDRARMSRANQPGRPEQLGRLRKVISSNTPVALKFAAVPLKTMAHGW